MTNLARAILLTSVLSTAGWAGSVHAEDYSAGKAPDGVSASRGAAMNEFQAARSKAPERTRAPGVASRAMADEAARIKAFGVVRHSRDGKNTRMDAAPGVVDAIRGKKKADAGTGGDSATDTAMGTERAVLGKDSRQRVTDTTAYPYDTVGFIEVSHKASGTRYSCTGALIGPRLVVTAARCIYDHGLDGGWMDEVTFWPGINGSDDIPFNGYKWDDAYVLDGFISEYDGGYDSVWPYDVALIILADPAGDDLGWLGYGEIKTGRTSTLNLIGYQSDKEEFTQWRTDCDVKASDIREFDLSHSCDADPWSTGAPLYVFDSKADTRHVIGIDLGALDNKSNWGIRFDEPILQWIDSVNE